MRNNATIGFRIGEMEALSLFGKEAISFIPAYGDWYDIATNIYTDAAKEMIIRASRETLHEKVLHDKNRIEDALADKPGREYDFWDQKRKEQGRRMGRDHEAGK